jgi:hypothetical protein
VPISLSYTHSTNIMHHTSLRPSLSPTPLLPTNIRFLAVWSALSLCIVSPHNTHQSWDKSNTIHYHTYYLSFPSKTFTLLLLWQVKDSSLILSWSPGANIIPIAQSLLFPVIIILNLHGMRIQFMFLLLSLMKCHLEWKKCFGCQ